MRGQSGIDTTVDDLRQMVEREIGSRNAAELQRNKQARARRRRVAAVQQVMERKVILRRPIARKLAVNLHGIIKAACKPTDGRKRVTKRAIMGFHAAGQQTLADRHHLRRERRTGRLEHRRQ